MFYEFSVTVPANTEDNAPVEQEMKLTHGVVHRLEVGFAPGCHGMVKVRILVGGHQLIPTNPEGYLASDAYNIPIDTFYDLNAAPYLLKAVISSPGTTYQHIIKVRVGVLPAEVIQPMSAVAKALQKFLKLVGVNT